VASSGRLRSRYARSAIRETLGSAGGPQSKSIVVDAPLRVCRSHSTNCQCCGLHPGLLNMPQGTASATLQGGCAAVVAAARHCCCSVQAAAACAISDLAPAAQRCILGKLSTPVRASEHTACDAAAGHHHFDRRAAGGCGDEHRGGGGRQRRRKEAQTELHVDLMAVAAAGGVRRQARRFTRVARGSVALLPRRQE